MSIPMSEDVRSGYVRKKKFENHLIPNPKLYLFGHCAAASVTLCKKTPSPQVLNRSRPSFISAMTPTYNRSSFNLMRSPSISENFFALQKLSEWRCPTASNSFLTIVFKQKAADAKIWS